MTNTAKILNFGRGNFAEQELRVADIDDGYTRFANELLEAIASADLTARQLKVMLAYVRKTYGFNKKTDRILLWLISMSAASRTYRLWKGKVRHLTSITTLSSTKILLVRLAIRVWRQRKQQVDWVPLQPVIS